MHFAVEAATSKVVEASRSLRRLTRYSCPHCKARVRLHAGKKKDPYFAHFANEGSPECEEYYPGGWGGTGIISQRVFAEVEDSPDDAGLCLDDADNSWAVYIRLPEIPNDELGDESLVTLKHAQVEVTAEGIRPETIPALELRPGVGSARLRVPPTSSEYRLTPKGNWPVKINTGRWILTSEGLRQVGTLFRFGRGEWVRLQEDSLVEWGERLCVVAHSTAAPPTPCNPVTVQSRDARSSGWKLWRIALPAQPHATVQRWLDALGHTASAPEAKIRILSVPDSFDLDTQVPRFARGTPIVAKVIAPYPGETSHLSLCFNSSKFSASSAPEPGSRESFFEISVAPGNYSLQLGGESEACAEFDCYESVDTKGLEKALRRLPKLRMSIGEELFETWSDRPADITLESRKRQPAVNIDLGLGRFRVDLTVSTKNVRRVRAQISPEESETIIQETLSKRQPFSFKLDAGALGSLTLNVKFTDSEENTDNPDRIAAWIASASVATAGEPNSLGTAVTRHVVEDSNLMTASMRCNCPALATQFRAAAKRRALNERRSKW